MKYLNPALLNDFYQITMAYGYFQAGIAEKTACFQLFFRKAPFLGNFAIACGLENAIKHIKSFRFTEEDIEYLKQRLDSAGKPLFSESFFSYLRNFQFKCDIESVAEGTVVFPQEPILKITGPLLQCQLLETPLLNMINFQTLIATKAARICAAAQHDKVIDFGLRRAQGFDGGISASRAAYIGGVHATSNMSAAHQFGIPISGTLGHSWIMSFANEKEAFLAYAKALPNNCVFLVDTYGSQSGIQNAIAVGQHLRQNNHELRGIRLDSGDLLSLSKQARILLNEAGFQNTCIIASGDLDEYKISSLKSAGAQIDTWGVGTRLVTAFDEPALCGTYKLVAIKDGDKWRSCSKNPDDIAKKTIPGALQIRRYTQNGFFVGDVLFDAFVSEPSLHCQDLNTKAAKGLPPDAHSTDLLIPIFQKGTCIYVPPSITETRNWVSNQLNSLPASTKRLQDPTSYPVYIDAMLAR